MTAHLPILNMTVLGPTSAATVGSLVTSHPKVREGHFKEFRGCGPLIVQ